MSEPVLELLLWILLAFFVGCILGCILKIAIGSRSVVATSAREAPLAAEPEDKPNAPPPSPARKEPQRPAKPSRAAVVERAPKTERKTAAPAADKPVRKQVPATAAAAANPGEQPKGIPTPRAGQPDKLQRISGIGPKIERTLHTLGIFHFDQMGSWTEDQVQWIESHLKFKGRIAREKWLEQAKLLADGNEAEFARIFGTEGARGAKPAAPPKRRAPRPPKTTSPA